MFSVQVLSIFSISSVEGKTDCSFLTANCSFKALFTQKGRVPNMHVLFIFSGVTPITFVTFLETGWTVKLSRNFEVGWKGEK